MTEEEKIEQSLIYIPEPVRPPDFDKKFAEIVGLNPETNRPGLRFVWGMDHRTWFQGEKAIHYIDPNGVYLGMPYFILEAWTSPEVYDRAEWAASRYGAPTGVYQVTRCEIARPEPCVQHLLRFGLHEEWDMTIDALGPFPEQGVWDFLCTIRNEDMTFAGHDRILEKAREWKFNHTRPEAAKRAMADYRKFVQDKETRKRAAERVMLDRMRGELEEHLAQAVPVADQGFSFSKDIESLGKRRSEGFVPPIIHPAGLLNPGLPSAPKGN